MERLRRRGLRARTAHHSGELTLQDVGGRSDHGYGDRAVRIALLDDVELAVVIGQRDFGQLAAVGAVDQQQAVLAEAAHSVGTRDGLVEGDLRRLSSRAILLYRDAEQFAGAE